MKNSVTIQKMKSRLTFFNGRSLKSNSFIVIFILSALWFSLQTPVNDIFSLSDVNLDQNVDDFQFKINQWTSHSPIFVHGIANFSQTAIAENWFGVGTKANPYIIEGYGIKDTGNLIVIQDTPFYFIIRNCNFNETSRVGSCIVIKNSPNGIIENNEFNKAYYGIEVIQSNHTIIQRNDLMNLSVGILIDSSYMNTINHNAFASNINYGISFVNKSASNTVAWNLLMESGSGTSEAFDSGSNNIFTFNYWSALTTPDNNGNGIVDIPYLIDGEANNRDSYSLVDQAPRDGYPDIHVMSEPKILYPNGGEISLTSLITIQWLKAVDVKNHPITYSLDYSTDTGITWSSMISGLTLTYFEWDLTNVYTDSTYIIRVTALCSEGLSKFDISDGSFSVIGLDPITDTTTTTIQVTNPNITTSLTNPQTTSNISQTTSEFSPNTIEPDIPIIIALFIVLLLITLPVIYRKRDSIVNIITKSRDNSLQDLLRKRAVSFDTLKEELHCGHLELPNKIKSVLGEKVKGSSLVFRSGMISLESIPPSGTMCQVCTGSLEGNTYFQCENCLRYVCLPHFVDLKKVGEATCPNCDGRLFILPFTCEGCNLDYNQIIDLESNLERCKHCGFTFPHQNQLIIDNTRDISSTVTLDDKDDYSDTKNKKK